jgi:hypothetical protein
MLTMLLLLINTSESLQIAGCRPACRNEVKAWLQVVTCNLKPVTLLWFLFSRYQLVYFKINLKIFRSLEHKTLNFKHRFIQRTRTQNAINIFWPTQNLYQ